MAKQIITAEVIVFQSGLNDKDQMFNVCGVKEYAARFGYKIKTLPDGNVQAIAKLPLTEDQIRKIKNV